MSDGYVCPECGLDYDTISPSDAVTAFRSFPRRYREAFGDADAATAHRRPDPATWSAVEYTAHVADVFEAFTQLVGRMRAGDGAKVDDLVWDQDERAAQQRYNDRAAEDVLTALAASAGTMADATAQVTASEWKRTAEFPWGERDLLIMVRNGVHEGAHHLRDIGRVLSAVR